MTRLPSQGSQETRDRSPGALLLALLAAAALYGSLVPGPSGPFALAAAAAFLPPALIAFALPRYTRSRRLQRGLALALALLLGGTLGSLLFLGSSARASGAGLAIQLVGLWILPLLVTGLGCARLFAGEHSLPADADR